MCSFTVAALCLIGRAFRRSSKKGLQSSTALPADARFATKWPRNTKDVAASEVLLILGKERFTSRPNKSKWVSVAADQQDAAIRRQSVEEGLQSGPVNILTGTRRLC